MSKKTVLSVIVLVAAMAATFPLFSCDQEPEPLWHSVWVVMPPETLTVARGTYWAKPYAEVTLSMCGYDPKPTLYMNLDCVGTFPDSNPKWYILNSDQMTEFGLGHPNQQFMNATLGGSGCTMWYQLSSSQTGTYWAVIDNRRSPNQDIRVKGEVYLRFFGL
jgi:hypothetical protein